MLNYEQEERLAIISENYNFDLKYIYGLTLVNLDNKPKIFSPHTWQIIKENTDFILQNIEQFYQNKWQINDMFSLYYENFNYIGLITFIKPSYKIESVERHNIRFICQETFKGIHFMKTFNPKAKLFWNF